MIGIQKIIGEKYAIGYPLILINWLSKLVLSFEYFINWEIAKFEEKSNRIF